MAQLQLIVSAMNSSNIHSLRSTLCWCFFFLMTGRVTSGWVVGEQKPLLHKGSPPPEVPGGGASHGIQPNVCPNCRRKCDSEEVAPVFRPNSGSDGCHGQLCDFCIYTEEGVHVERIRFSGFPRRSGRGCCQSWRLFIWIPFSQPCWKQVFNRLPDHSI